MDREAVPPPRTRTAPTTSQPAPRPRPTPASRAVESEGPSVAEAVRKGLCELGPVDASQVQVEVVQEPVKGFFGRLKPPAEVRLTTGFS